MLALQSLGFPLEADGTTVTVTGQGGSFPVDRADLDMQLSGTSLRFLVPILAAGHGEYRFHGTQRMHQRPVGDLLDALVRLGVDVRSEADTGCPPVLLSARGLKGGATVVQGERSSQFLSGLLLAAPLASGGLDIMVEGDLQSRPFVDLTLSMMQDFGVTVQRTGYERFLVQPQQYRARDLAIEGDATAAGNFWVAAAITGGTVRVNNVGTGTVQGDRGLADVLGTMGCSVEWTGTGCTVTGPESGLLRGGTFDLNDMPDQVLPLSVAGLFTDTPLTITNVSNLRIKETDRISALVNELRAVGAHVEEGPDWLRVHPLTDPKPAAISTYGDHRMAMAFAVAALRVDGIEIIDPDCVNKTYPDYWRDMAALRASAGAT